ncbi:helix-turn-helix domain-containing protein [Tsukamurella soli]|uniref:helix-turn-helix domain-containing protein n=1 Tax=Tsukamurella soli TaxID=644556 RepID=UPI00361FA91C
MSSIQLLTKAGQVVDELARSGPSTPAELAKAVAEPRPTVYRIGSALEELELVRAAGAGRLELAVGLLRWGTPRSRRSSIVARCTRNCTGCASTWG